MNRTELINAVKSKTGRSFQEVEAILKAATEVIGDTIKAGDKVTVTCFGTFEPKDTAAREYRNPHTGGTVQAEASRKVKFKPGKELKDKVGLA